MSKGVLSLWNWSWNCFWTNNIFGLFLTKFFCEAKWSKILRPYFVFVQILWTNNFFNIDFLIIFFPNTIIWIKSIVCPNFLKAVRSPLSLPQAKYMHGGVRWGYSTYLPQQCCDFSFSFALKDSTKFLFQHRISVPIYFCPTTLLLKDI